MKTIFTIIVLVIFFASAIIYFGVLQPEETKVVLYDNRESLEILFSEKSEELNTILTDDQFFVHVKSLEFAFDGVKDGSVVDWEGPEGKLTGKVIIYKTISDENKLCKDFTQTLNIEEKEYQGKATACAIGTTWNLRKADFPDMVWKPAITE